jgi:hypothetical protein
MGEWKARFLFCFVIAGAAAGICVSLAVAVRIGNAILGS